MACPYFEPVTPLPDAPGGGRFPLIDAWTGVCRAGDPPFEPPDESTLRGACNFGYARGSCPRFPADGPDAARFHVLEDESVVWVLEKDWAPAGHGRFDRTAWEGQPAAGMLAKQAGACLESYRKRKRQADGRN